MTGFFKIGGNMDYRFIKFNLFIILVGIFLSGWPVQAAENARTLLQKDDRLMKILMSDQTIYKNLATEMIDTIWTIDQRPDRVVIELKFSKFSQNTSGKILRIHRDGDKEIVSIFLADFIFQNGKYHYFDKNATATTGIYIYQILIEDPHSDKWHLSKRVFTVPQPKLTKWWDWEDKETQEKYIDGVNDTLFFDRKSLMTENPEHWEPDSMRYRIDDSDTGAWISFKTPDDFIVIDTTIVNHGNTVSYFVQTKDSIGNMSRWSWEYKAILYLESPPSVTDLKVTNILPEWAKSKYHQADGNLYLEWTKPNWQAVRALIWRKEMPYGKFEKIDSLPIESTTITYVDSCIKKNDRLFVLNSYEYYVTTENASGRASIESNYDTSFCNRKVDSLNCNPGTEPTYWTIRWKPIITNLKKSEFIYKGECYKYNLSGDLILDQVQETTDTFLTFKVKADTSYCCILYAYIMDSDNKKTIPVSYRRDARVAPIPPITYEELHLLPQPKAFGIFIDWHDYWKNDFWKSNPTSMVAYFRILKYAFSKGKYTLKGNFPILQNTENWENGQYLDIQQLTIDTLVYSVIPYFITPESAEIKPSVNYRKKVVQIHDRLFIPQIDATNFPVGLSNKKMFFRMNSNQLTVKWTYPEKKCNSNMKNIYTPKRIRIQFSNNESFKMTGVLTQDSPYHDDVSVNSVIFHDIKRLDHHNHDPYFLRITAFNTPEKYEHPYWSTDFDSLIRIYNDDNPPTNSSFTKVIAEPHPDSQEGKILLKLTWNEALEDPLTESGVNYYVLARKSKGLEYQVKKCDTSFAVGDSLLTNENFTAYVETLKIYPKDIVGNSGESSLSKKWYPIPPPKDFVITKVPNTECTYIFEWSPVEYLDEIPIDSYYLQWTTYSNPSMKNVKTQSEFNYYTIPGDSTRIKRTHNAFKGCNFRIRAQIYGEFDTLQSSGWSKTIPLPDAGNVLYKSNEFEIDEIVLPTSFSLKQNYPNPFNSQTIIEYWVPENSSVAIQIYNLQGEEIRTLVNREHIPGVYREIWDGTDRKQYIVPSGVYFIVIKAPQYYEIKKCLLLQ